MSLRVGRSIERGTLLLLLLWALFPRAAAAQACPLDKYCFYVPPGLPLEGSHSGAASRVFDLVLSSPVRTVTGTYSVSGAAPVSFSVAPGSSVRISLTGMSGRASGYGVAEQRGVLLIADSQDLTVDHRETFDQEQYSETIKRHSIALGSRFRLGGYSLDLEDRPLAGADAVMIFAPTGGTVTLTAPPGATLPFWSGSATAQYTATLTDGQTLAVRTEIGRDLDGSLLTSSEPVAVSSGGRGWSSGGCGDDGMDGLVPVSALGTEHVVQLPTGSSAANNESRVRVIADVDDTQVRVNGALVATLAAGANYSFQPSALSRIVTSRPALVWMNGSLNGCELDTVLIPPIAFAPALTELSLDFNVLASTQMPPAELAVLIATADVDTIRLNGVAPTFTVNQIVNGRPDLSYVRFNVAAGDQNVRAGSDFQAMLASRTSPSGLLAYYNPYRIPGCGDGGIDPGETCDDGDSSDGDGCSSLCQVEPGYSCVGTPSVCSTICGDSSIAAPIESCDDGNATAGDGCNSTCRPEVRFTSPATGSSTGDTTPTFTGTADRNVTVTVSIDGVTGTTVSDASGVWSFTPSSALAEGTRTITASASDARSGSSSASLTLSIDASTTLTIATPSPNSVTGDTTPTITGSGEAGATLQVSIDGSSVGSTTVQPDGSWELTVTTPLAAGVRMVSASATDALNNMVSASAVSFTVDTGTFVMLDTPAVGAVLRSASPLITGTAEPGATVSIQIDMAVVGSVVVGGDGRFSFMVTMSLAEGAHDVRADAIDATGNTASDQRMFSVDSMARVEISEPLAGSIVNSATPEITGSGEPGASVEVSIDGAVIATVTVDASGAFRAIPSAALRDGPHAVEVRLTDSVGNEARSAVDFSVATRTQPLLVILNPPDGARTRDPRPVLSGFSHPGALVSVSIDGVLLETLTSSARGSWSLRLATALADGSHTVFATTTDGAGNTVDDLNTFVVDLRAPPITLLIPADGTVLRDDTPSISGTSEPSARVQISIDGTPVGETTTAADGSWSIELTTPLPEGRHSARAVASDAVGNHASVEVGFHLDLRTFVDVRVPPDGGTTGSATPTIAGSAEPLAMVSVAIDGVAVGTVDVNLDGSWWIATTTALTPGLHRVTARALDALGNEASDESTFSYDSAFQDSDGDGRSDEDECAAATLGGPCRDSDGDGVTDPNDPDDDGDGIATIIECGRARCPDHDGDGVPDQLDDDDDNDGRPTSRERAQDGKPRDTDRDGIPDHLDLDDDGDGIPTREECTSNPCVDSDGDYTPDFLDPDDDNDDVPTARERADGTTHGNDPDGDGLVNWRDPDANANQASDGRDGLADTDGDGIPDYLDLDTPAPDLSIDQDYAIAGGGGCALAANDTGSPPYALALSWLALVAAIRRRRSR